MAFFPPQPPPVQHTLEHLVAGGEDVPRVKVLLGVAESPPGRPEVPAPVVTGHREGADRVQRAAGGPDPLVDGPVGRHEPVDFGGVIGRRDPYQVERVYQVSAGSRSSGLVTAWLRNAESTTWPKVPGPPASAWPTRR